MILALAVLYVLLCVAGYCMFAAVPRDEDKATAKVVARPARKDAA